MNPSVRSEATSKTVARLVTLMLRIATVIVLLAVVCGSAAAVQPKPTSKACVTNEADIAGLSGDASTDVHAVQNFIRTAGYMLEQQKFDELECLADSFRASKETFPGGLSKLHNLYGGVAMPRAHSTEEDWKAHLEIVRKWAAAKPQSITARIALAESYINWAQKARGNGYTDTVSESGWKMFQERNREAKRVLDGASQPEINCPEWYLAMQMVAVALNWNRSARHALFERAIKFDPDYYYYYRIYAEYSQTRWGGDPGESEEFLQFEANRLGGDAGDIVYFQVAAYAFCGCSSDNDLHLSWPRIQRGFAALERRSGTAVDNLNLMAALAVSFNDPVVANAMFSRIGDEWSQAKWSTLARYNASREWARQQAPIEQKNPTTEAEAH